MTLGVRNRKAGGRGWREEEIVRWEGQDGSEELSIFNCLRYVATGSVALTCTSC